MKLLLSLIITTFVLVECKHTFLGTNVMRNIVYHHQAEYGAKIFKKRVENLYFSVPNVPTFQGKTIQGILAYDMTHSLASANVTQGGLGFNYVNLRMKSERGMKLHYNVFVYV